MQLHDVYAVTGLLKNHFPDYEIRDGQVKMSALVEQAIAEKRAAVIEGATGVGKSFAYLIPCILSGKSVTVSTSNKSLQDQLNQKDLPTLLAIFSGKMALTWAVLKGKNNYFCHERFEANHIEIIKELLPESGREEDIDEAQVKKQQIRDWVEQDGIGDMEFCPIEIPFKARELLCCNNHTTHEKDTLEAEYCYALQARERAKQAQIVLVNHTLLALDMNLRKDSDGKIGFLPQTDVVVIDEAHEFEKAAILAFSDEISIFSLYHILNRNLVQKNLPDTQRNKIVSSLKNVLTAYTPQKGLNNYYLEQETEYFEGLEPVIEYLENVKNALYRLEATADDRTKKAGMQIVKEVENFQERLQALTKPDTHMIRWSEAKDDKRGEPIVKLKTVPFDISPLIREGLFLENKPVICCSATLSVYGSFSYFKEQVGMPLTSLELIVPSHFDYKKQALIYVSDGSQDKYYEIGELLKYSQGRAFILFTSYREMLQAYDIVKTEHPKFIQNNRMPRSQLLQEFLATPNAVLFATKSFWEGVDVKGDKLSLVVIDRVPFEVPSNLVFKAKCNRYDEKHGRGKSFIHLSVPDACLKIKQGAGRLIRSASDRGVIALLDTRVNTKPYGRIIIESMPPAYRTQQLPKVERFFQML